MKIYKRAQASGARKIKLRIRMNFVTGEVDFGFKDNQFGPRGAPCSKTLSKLVDGMSDLEPAKVSTSGFADKDTSNQKPVPREVQPAAEEEIVTPEQQQQNI